MRSSWRRQCRPGLFWKEVFYGMSEGVTNFGRDTVKLFSFSRALATFTVRIALNLKGVVPDEIIDVNLMQGKQRADAFRAVKPQMLLPALIDADGPVLFQSLAIIEYLD